MKKFYYFSFHSSAFCDNLYLNTLELQTEPFSSFSKVKKNWLYV